MCSIRLAILSEPVFVFVRGVSERTWVVGVIGMDALGKEVAVCVRAIRLAQGVVGWSEGEELDTEYIPDSVVVWESKKSAKSISRSSQLIKSPVKVENSGMAVANALSRIISSSIVGTCGFSSVENPVAEGCTPFRRLVNTYSPLCVSGAASWVGLAG